MTDNIDLYVDVSCFFDTLIEKKLIVGNPLFYSDLMDATVQDSIFDYVRKYADTTDALVSCFMDSVDCKKSLILHSGIVTCSDIGAMITSSTTLYNSDGFLQRLREALKYSTTVVAQCKAQDKVRLIITEAISHGKPFMVLLDGLCFKPTVILHNGLSHKYIKTAIVFITNKAFDNYLVGNSTRFSTEDISSDVWSTIKEYGYFKEDIKSAYYLYNHHSRFICLCI